MNKLLLLIFFLFANAEHRPFTVHWNTNFSDALQAARSENKMILLYFSGSDWCKPCIKMKRYILETPEFISYAENRYVLLQVDFPRLKKNQPDAEQIEQNEALAEKYNRNGLFPLLLVLNTEGKVLQKIEYANQSCAEVLKALSSVEM